MRQSSMSNIPALVQFEQIAITSPEPKVLFGITVTDLMGWIFLRLLC